MTKGKSIKKKGRKIEKEITPEFIEEIKTRLNNGYRVRRNLPYNGRLNIDRNLPFLIIYRRSRAAILRGPRFPRAVRREDRMMALKN